ncbi:30085_t:CDS:2 [Gigaspora margarita]|uniref:30085_t:CDS:1 n=1 Tax=Gigaspora margarita TaxID=4874 RepID=A0ABN7VMY9_GIGMA|nr:30085_t:CDS:2 [Gigaspora margarita]
MSLHGPCLTIPDCDYKLLEKIVLANPCFYEMNLIEGQLEIIMSPTHNITNERKAETIYQIGHWRKSNKNLVGYWGGSSVHIQASPYYINHFHVNIFLLIVGRL